MKLSSLVYELSLVETGISTGSSRSLTGLQRHFSDSDEAF